MISDDRAFREAVLEGDTIRAIAKRHDESRSTVHRAIRRGAEAHVEQVHKDLLTSHATGEVPAILLPDQPGPTMNRALDYARWLTNELDERGIKVRVHYRPAKNGLVIAFSDADPPEGSRVDYDRLDNKENTPS